MPVSLDMSDDTLALQKLLDNAGRVLIPPGEYWISSLDVRSGTNLILTPRTVINQLPGLPNTDLLRIYGVHDVRITGGIFDGSAGVYSLGVAILNAERVLVDGTISKNMKTLAGARGDGFYINSSVNITLSRVKALKNERDGLSLISGRKIKILDSEFSGTSQPVPGAGIDIEPNTLADILHDVLIARCIIKGNHHGIIHDNPQGASCHNVVLLQNNVSGNRSFGMAINSHHDNDNPYVLAGNIINNNGGRPLGVTFTPHLRMVRNLIMDNRNRASLELRFTQHWNITDNLFVRNAAGCSIDPVGGYVPNDRLPQYGLFARNQVIDCAGSGLVVNSQNSDPEPRVKILDNTFRNTLPNGPMVRAVQTYGLHDTVRLSRNRLWHVGELVRHS